jgi:transposase
LRGSRPQQIASQRRDRLSVIASLALTPVQRRIKLSFHVQPRNVCAPDVVRYLRALRRQHGGELIVIMDRLGAHQKAVKDLRKKGAPWLSVEWLPGYAPDLNPVEPLWSHSKYTSLANFVPDDIEHLDDAVLNAIDAIYFKPHLLRSFFQAAKLKL